jgi:hypothetical protein
MLDAVSWAPGNNPVSPVPVMLSTGCGRASSIENKALLPAAPPLPICRVPETVIDAVLSSSYFKRSGK